MPFEIPASWEWTTVNDIAQSNIGLTYNPSEICNNGVPVLRSNNIKNQKLCWDDVVRVNSVILEKQYLQEGDLLICARNGSRNLVGKCALINNLTEPVSFGAFMAVCRSNYNPWIYYILHTDYFNRYLDDSNSTAINQVTQKMLLAFPVPFPPYEEQKRIVVEVQRWFDIIDTLEVSKQDLLGAIKQTKSRVLDLAIHGKLVPQDPNDEPASELLKRINPSIKPCDTSHYENLPQGWAICRLSDIAKITAGGTPSRKITSYWEGGTIPWLKIADMTASGKYVRTASEYITEEGMKNSSAKLMNKGTLLYTIFASIGEVGILDFDATCNQAIANIDLHMPEMTDYIYYYLKNLQTYMYSISKGCTQQNINQGILKNATIPLPPLSEQKRIVERIETIFASLDTITAEL